MAGTTVGKLNALLTADTSQFSSQLTGAGNTLTGFAKSLSSSLGIGLSVGAVVGGIQQAVSAAEESFEVQKKLEAVLDATGHAAGFTADQLSKYADDLSRLTGIDDEAIKSAEALLATFTNVRGDTFTRTIALSLDLARHKTIDAADAAQILGKALADPTHAAGKLTKAGIVLTDAQKSTIQTMMEMNDIAGAQAVILDAVAGKVEGTAERMRSAWKGVRVEWDNLLEAYGRFGSTEGAGGAADMLSALLSRQSKAVDGISELIKELSGLEDELLKAFAPEWLQDAVTLWERLKTSFLRGGPVVPPEPGDIGGGAEDIAELSGKQVESLEEFEAALRRQIATMEMSRTEAALWALEHEKNIPAAALESARALAEELEKLEEAAADIEKIRANEKAVDAINRSIMEQFETLGMTNAQLEAYRAKMLGATDAEIAWIRSATEFNDTMQKQLDTWTSLESVGAADLFDEFVRDSERLADAFNQGNISLDAYTNSIKKLEDAFNDSMREEADRIHRSVMTPLEKAQEEIDNLNTLLERGVLPLEDYERKLLQIEDTLSDSADNAERLSPALDFQSAEGFAALAPRNVDSASNRGDTRTHEHLVQVQQLLREIERAVEENQPVNIGTVA